MSYDPPNPGIWERIGTVPGGEWSKKGGDNFGWGTVPTEKQELTFSGNLIVYRLGQKVPGLNSDYYLVAGTIFHGISGSPSNPASNWVSVGFYSNYHSLVLRCTTPGARVLEFGPNSTVEQVSVSFTIGGSLTGEAGGGPDGPSGGASLGIEASVGVSFSSEAVRFAARPTLSSMEWRVDLPGVGFVSPGVPANPFRASYAGYLWNPAAIFKVPEGAPFSLGADLSVDFEYNWTRGITKRHFTDTLPLSFTHPAVGAEALEAAPRPTILETLRELCAPGSGADGDADTFLAALESDWLKSTFGDSNLETLVVVPTNQAIEGYLTEHPDVALESGGPLGPRWLSTWLMDHMRNLVPVSDDQRARLEARATADSGNRTFFCSDGIVVLTDDFDAAEHVDSVMTALDEG
jgi:hypothetical protein